MSYIYMVQMDIPEAMDSELNRVYDAEHVPALSKVPGVFHVTNQGPTTWYGLARAVVEMTGLDPSVIEPISTAQLDPPRPAPRPANSVLDNLALRLSGRPLLPDWHDGAARLVAHVQKENA